MWDSFWWWFAGASFGWFLSGLIMERRCRRDVEEIRKVSRAQLDEMSKMDEQRFAELRRKIGLPPRRTEMN